MYSANTVSKIKLVQTGLTYMALMQYTAFIWPQNNTVEDGATYDYIIVGAGTAGSVIANRLTEDNCTMVLLIEAGGDPPIEAVVPGTGIFLKKSRFDWNFTAEINGIANKCHQKPNFHISSGKMIGGTSSLNYLMYSRGHPTDYNNWANITDDSTWEWENVLPYFKKSERIEDEHLLKSTEINNYGTDGLVGLTRDDGEHVYDILESFKELGHDVPNVPVRGLGYSKNLLYIGKGGRQSSGFTYLRPIRNRKNLHMLKNTLVTKINIDENKNAVGVDLALEDGRTVTIKAAKEVIVSAGAFNSAKLLMLSGIGPKTDMESNKIEVISDLPVGKNLQDHIGVLISHAMEKSVAPPLNPNKFPGSPMMGFTALDKSQQYPDYETMLFSGHADLILHFCAFAYRFNYEICDQNYEFMRNRMGLFNKIVLLNPKSRGEVKLKSLNPMDPPIISTGYLSDQADLDNLVRYIKDFIPIINTTHFRNIGAEMMYFDIDGCASEKGSDEYWKCYASCLFSGLGDYTGTCAMGSVVDSRLRVIGVNQLRVADASVIPVITRGNTNGPVMMIGEKASDFIKEDSKMLQAAQKLGV